MSSVSVNIFVQLKADTCPSGFWKMPDWPAAGALSAYYQRPFEVQSGTFYERLDNQLIYCWLQICFLHVFFIFAADLSEIM